MNWEVHNPDVHSRGSDQSITWRDNRNQFDVAQVISKGRVQTHQQLSDAGDQFGPKFGDHNGGNEKGSRKIGVSGHANVNNYGARGDTRNDTGFTQGHDNGSGDNVQYLPSSLIDGEGNNGYVQRQPRVVSREMRVRANELSDTIWRAFQTNETVLEQELGYETTQDMLKAVSVLYKGVAGKKATLPASETDLVQGLQMIAEFSEAQPLTSEMVKIFQDAVKSLSSEDRRLFDEWQVGLLAGLGLVVAVAGVNLAVLARKKPRLAAVLVTAAVALACQNNPSVVLTPLPVEASEVAEDPTLEPTEEVSPVPTNVPEVLPTPTSVYPEITATPSPAVRRPGLEEAKAGPENVGGPISETMRGFVSVLVDGLAELGFTLHPEHPALTYELRGANNAWRGQAVAIDEQGRMIWAHKVQPDGSLLPYDFPAFYSLNEAGEPIALQHEVLIDGEEVQLEYQAIEGSEGAEVVFVNGEFPVPMKERVEINGETYFKYFLDIDGQWKENPDVVAAWEEFGDGGRNAEELGLSSSSVVITEDDGDLIVAVDVDDYEVQMALRLKQELADKADLLGEFIGKMFEFADVTGADFPDYMIDEHRRNIVIKREDGSKDEFVIDQRNGVIFRLGTPDEAVWLPRQIMHNGSSYNFTAEDETLVVWIGNRDPRKFLDPNFLAMDMRVPMFAFQEQRYLRGADNLFEVDPAGYYEGIEEDPVLGPILADEARLIVDEGIFGDGWLEVR